MIHKLIQAITVLAVSTLLLSCNMEKEKLRIGSKDFSENMILAEMIAQLAEKEGIAVERNIPFGNTAKVMEANKQGVLDIYPEYNGTGLIFLGQAPSSDGDATMAKVRELFQPLGLDWKDRFGFSNDYAIVMTSEKVQETGIESISDLAKLGTPINVAVDANFAVRAADGLRPLIRRYGLTMGNIAEFPSTSEGKDQIISALLDGSADIAELFATDGQIVEYNLVVLKDDQDFFPVYQAAPLVRTEALEKIPELGGILGKLSGIISAQDMQALNKAVDLDAQTPASVATAFLVSKGLLPEDTEASTVKKLLVAADPSIGRSSETAKALRAIRAGFSGNDLELSNTPAPLRALANGSARVAMVGAESFYSVGEKGPIPKGIAQAFAVLGYKSGHLLGKNVGPATISDMKKISTGVEGSSSAIMLHMILSSLGLAGTVEVSNTADNLSDQVQSLASGDVDGVFVTAAKGDRDVTKVLKSGDMCLLGINEWADGGHTARYSFIRPTTIAASTYPSQDQPLASVETQFVLTSPVEKEQETGEVGPGTAGVASVMPVSAEAVKLINKAIGSGETVDPAIPVHAALSPEIDVADKTLPFSPDVSVLNIAIIVFVVWVIYLIGLPSPRRINMPNDSK